MWLELGNLFTDLSSNSSVLAIVLSGSNPKAFTAGLDTTTFAAGPLFQTQGSGDPARQSHALRAFITTFQDCLTAVKKCSKPVIAAIHGHCLGLGVDLSLCADVRYAAADTAFAVKEVDLGLAADVGTLSRMPKVVGNGSWIWDVCLSGRGFQAQEAKEMGLVSRVCEGGAKEVVGEALKWAVLVASKSPVAVAGTKEILQWSWDRSVEDGKIIPPLFPSGDHLLEPSLGDNCSIANVCLIAQDSVTPPYGTAPCCRAPTSKRLLWQGYKSAGPAFQSCSPTFSFIIRPRWSQATGS